MKTKEQIAAEDGIIDADSVFTLREFIEACEDGYITSYDGNGYFHNGEKRTDISVWNNTLTWNDVKDYPYVCWYNK